MNYSHHGNMSLFNMIDRVYSHGGIYSIIIESDLCNTEQDVN